MNNYRRLISFVIPHIGVLVLAFLCMVISSAFGGVSIGMIIPLVDNVISGKKIVISHSITLPGPIVSITCQKRCRAERGRGWR